MWRSRKMRICPQCQQAVDDLSERCPSCGAGLEEALMNSALEEDIGENADLPEFPDLENPAFKDDFEPLPTFATAEEQEAANPFKPLAQPIEEAREEIETVQMAPSQAAASPARITPAPPPRTAAAAPAAAPVAKPSPFKKGPGAPAPRPSASQSVASGAARPAPKRSTPPSRRKQQEAEAAQAAEAQAERPAPRTPSAPSADGSDSFLNNDPEHANLSQYQMNGETPTLAMGAEEDFKPLPPFVLADEGAAPSPFAPSKQDFSHVKDEVDDTPRPSSPTYKANPADYTKEIQAMIKICPICQSRAFNDEPVCGGCGYKFPKVDRFGSSGLHPNILAILASVAMGLAVFVDFITYDVNGSSQTFTLLSRLDGYAFLLLAILALVLGIFGRSGGVAIVGAVSVCGVVAENWYMIYDLTQVQKAGHIDNEIGFYLLIAGACAILAAGLFGFFRARKAKQNYVNPYMK